MVGAGVMVIGTTVGGCVGTVGVVGAATVISGRGIGTGTFAGTGLAAR